MLLTDAQVAKLLAIREAAIDVANGAYAPETTKLAELLAEALDEISKASRRRRRDR